MFAGIVVALVALIALFGGPNGPLSSPSPAEASPICYETGIVTGTSVTWDNTCIHVVYNFYIGGGGPTLSITPGTIVKMKMPTGPLDTNIILDGAHLIAHGTAANPIIITSWHDDTAGPDDTDGVSQAPAPGDWKNIMVTSDGYGNDGSIDLDYVVVKYGGSCRAMITNQYVGSACNQYSNLGTQTVIDHSVIQCSLTDGIHLDNSAGLMISNSVIADNGGDGVFGDGSASATATQNWWGAADGPGPVGPGSGDGVSANVDFSNWLTTDPLQSSSCLPPAVPPGPPVVGGTTELLTSDGGTTELLTSDAGNSSSIWWSLALAAGVALLGVAALGARRFLKR